MGDDLGVAERWRQLQAGELSPEDAAGFLAFLRENRASMDDDVKAYLDSLDKNTSNSLAGGSGSDPGSVLEVPSPDPAAAAPHPGVTTGFPHAPDPDVVAAVDPPALSPSEVEAFELGLTPDERALADFGPPADGTASESDGAPPSTGSIVDQLNPNSPSDAEPDTADVAFQTPGVGSEAVVTVQDQGMTTEVSSPTTPADAAPAEEDQAALSAAEDEAIREFGSTLSDTPSPPPPQFMGVLDNVPDDAASAPADAAPAEEDQAALSAAEDEAIREFASTLGDTTAAPPPQQFMGVLDSTPDSAAAAPVDAASAEEDQAALSAAEDEAIREFASTLGDTTAAPPTPQFMGVLDSTPDAAATAPSASSIVISESNPWWSWLTDLYDRMGTFGCLVGVVFVLALTVLGAFELYSHTFGAPTTSTASNPVNRTSAGLVIGSPITGTQSYSVHIGSSVTTRTEAVSLSGAILSVDTLPAAGTTGSSCVDYRKDFSATSVTRTEQIFHLCSGGGTSVTTTCTPGFPLFMTSLQLSVPQTFSDTCTTPSTSPTATTAQSYTDSGTITLTKTIKVGGGTYDVVMREYSRKFSSPGSSAITFNETSVYRVDRWQEIGTTTTTTAFGSTSSSQFQLLGAPSAVLTLLPPPVASSGPTSGGPTTGGTSNGSTSFVTIPFNQLSFTPPQSICQSGGALQLGLTIDGIPNGTQVVMMVNGPTLNRSFTFLANPGQVFNQSFPIPKGGGVYSDTIESIGGKAPPGAGSHVTGSFQC